MRAIVLLGWAALSLAAATASAQMTVARASRTASPADNELLRPSTTKGPFYDQSEAELRARKLARGVANVLFCVAELPNQMMQEAYRTSPVTGSVVGAWKGLIKGSQRLVIGLWEVATFYDPTKNNYQPYIEPEVIFQDLLH